MENYNLNCSLISIQFHQQWMKGFCLQAIAIHWCLNSNKMDGFFERTSLSLDPVEKDKIKKNVINTSTFN